MRTALISDIHANLQALEAVLESIREAEVDAVACLGDTVGYGADPRRCIELVRALDCPYVIGNHDYYAVVRSVEMDALLSSSGVRDQPVWAGIKLAREQLSDEQLKWLRERDSAGRVEGARIAHAALHDFESWPYLRTMVEARPTLDLLGDQVGFFGHTHREAVFVPESSPAPELLEDGSLRLPEGAAAITVGSAGQPRDGDPRARWVLWDDERRSVDFRRVSYDVDAACEAILAAGLPPLNGFRLYNEA